ncbi:MAG: hypothetical protein H0U73_13950 [Tatlockia sp.]|nr:hypothetical protein [Tatlockia sp.]
MTYAKIEISKKSRNRKNNPCLEPQQTKQPISKTEFFKVDPEQFYKAGITQYNHQNYIKACDFFEEAHQYFVAQKGLISEETLKCYLKLAETYLHLGMLDYAQIKYEMASSILSSLPNKDEQFLLDIMTNLANIEFNLLAINQEGKDKQSLPIKPSSAEIGLAINQDGDESNECSPNL